jgi:hypothetical protein
LYAEKGSLSCHQPQPSTVNWWVEATWIRRALASWLCHAVCLRISSYPPADDRHHQLIMTTRATPGPRGGGAATAMGFVPPRSHGHAWNVTFYDGGWPKINPRNIRDEWNQTRPAALTLCHSSFVCCPEILEHQIFVGRPAALPSLWVRPAPNGASSVVAAGAWARARGPWIFVLRFRSFHRGPRTRVEPMEDGRIGHVGCGLCYESDGKRPSTEGNKNVAKEVQTCVHRRREKKPLAWQDSGFGPQIKRIAATGPPPTV